MLCCSQVRQEPRGEKPSDRHTETLCSTSQLLCNYKSFQSGKFSKIRLGDFGMPSHLSVGLILRALAASFPNHHQGVAEPPAPTPPDPHSLIHQALSPPSAEPTGTQAGLGSALTQVMK